MKTTQTGSKLWLALVAGMVCSTVLMMTSHSHAAMKSASAVQNVQTVVVSAKRMSAAEKAQARAELELQDNFRA